KAPDDPAINFGTGDFSFDAWIRTPQAQGVGGTIIDKRAPVGSSAVFGYHALVDPNGNFAFELATGASSTYSVPGTAGFIADSQWHHIAATVVRNSTTGLKLYIDGVATTFDPTPRSGNLTNTAPFFVAASRP